MTKKPLISCLCVTKNDSVRKAVAYFQKQTYDNKELILVSEMNNENLSYLQEVAANNGDIHFTMIGDMITLGDLRNISVAEANGEYVVQWDDDDYFHEERIEIMYNALIAQPDKEAAFLRTVMIHDKIANRVALSRNWGGVEGSMIAKTKAMIDYQSLNKAEDTAVRDYFLRRGMGVLVDRPDIYTYILHGENTWDYGHLSALTRINSTPIPRLIHQIWIGEEIPKKFKEFTDKMKDMHIPLGYIYKLWGNELWKIYADDPFIASYAKGNYPLAYVKDRFVMLLLRDYGGITVDPDCEIIKSFDTIINKLGKNITYFAGMRGKVDPRGALIECGIQGTVPNSRVVRELLTVWDNVKYAPGGLRTSDKLITIIDTDVAILNYKYFFGNTIDDTTVLLHEPHTLDSWRDPIARKQIQIQRKNIIEKIAQLT